MSTITIADAERFAAIFKAAAIARKTTKLGERPIIEGVHLQYDPSTGDLVVEGTNSYVLFEGRRPATGKHDFSVTLSADVAKAIAADKTLAKAAGIVIDISPDDVPNVTVSVDGAPRWVCADAGQYPRTASLWPPTDGDTAEVVGLDPKCLATITAMAKALGSEYLTLRNGATDIKPMTVGFAGGHGLGCRALIMPVRVKS